MEEKVLKAMKKFEGREVKVTQSGIVESKFYIKNFKHVMEDGILAIEDGDNAYIDIYIDDIEKLYFESTPNGYAILVLNLGRDIDLELQTNEDKVVSIRDKLWNYLVESGMAEEIFKETCGA